jgi:RNA polymerase sigma factor (sigma-70 family)
LSTTPDREQLEQLATTLVQCKARRLVGRAGLRPQDCNDVAQELIARIHAALDHYNPTLGTPRAFLNAALDNAGRNLLRDRRARKRGVKTPLSLNLPVHDGERSIELADTLPAETLQAHRGHYPRGDEERAQLAHDVNKVVEQLPEDLRVVAELLKSHTIADAARILRIPRSTLTSRISRIRERFEVAGFRDYLAE